jgi:hypothetical protein
MNKKLKLHRLDYHVLFVNRTSSSKKNNQDIRANQNFRSESTEWITYLDLRIEIHNSLIRKERNRWDTVDIMLHQRLGEVLRDISMVDQSDQLRTLLVIPVPE